MRWISWVLKLNELLVSQKCYQPNPHQLLRRNGYEIFPLAGSVNGLL